MIFKKTIKHIDSKKIEKAIEDFEKSVDFEFIPMIAHKSSYIEHISWVISLLVLVMAIGIIDWLFSTHLYDSWMSKTPFYIAAPFVAFAFGILLDKSDYVDRFFITKKERQRQVYEKAELSFYRRRLHELKSKNALLLYISVMERQIVLRPDPNMQFADMNKVTEELLGLLQVSFKDGDFEAGIIGAIAHLKTSLISHFPKTDLSINEMPNKLIWIND